MNRIKSWGALLLASVAAPALYAERPVVQPAVHGRPGDAPCLVCHSAIRAALQRKFVHASIELGCPTCHINHREAPEKEGMQKATHYLNERMPELCLTCHEGNDERLIAAHRGQPFARAICTGCHDPHSSEVPKLVAERAHGPFGARKCESCHQPPKDGKIRLVAATTNELCFGCHEDFKNRLVRAKVQHNLLAPGAKAVSCTDCHDPHASNYDRQLKKPLRATCTGCHASMTADKKFLHEPARTSCVLCHDAHASDLPFGLKAETNTVCTTCHGQATRLAKNPAGGFLAFASTVIPAEYVQQATKIVLGNNGKGHPYEDHPVAGVPDRSRRGQTMSCVSCHNPHAGNFRQLYQQDLPGQTLCGLCHEGLALRPEDPIFVPTTHLLDLRNDQELLRALSIQLAKTHSTSR